MSGQADKAPRPGRHPARLPRHSAPLPGARPRLAPFLGSLGLGSVLADDMGLEDQFSFALVEHGHRGPHCWSARCRAATGSVEAEKIHPRPDRPRPPRIRTPVGDELTQESTSRPLITTYGVAFATDPPDSAPAPEPEQKSRTRQHRPPPIQPTGTPPKTTPPTHQLTNPRGSHTMNRPNSIQASPSGRAVQ